MGSTVPLGWLSLYDRFPGKANPNLGIPTGGWANTTDNCVTLPTYPVGTKIQAYTDYTTNPGYYTMMYGAYCSLCAAADITQDFSGGTMWCGHCDLTSDTGDATYEIPFYESVDVSALPFCWLASCYSAQCTDISLGGPVAVPCCTLDGYDYGWFWVGGVCPQADVTIFQGLGDQSGGADITCGGSIEGGAWFACVTGTTMLPYQEWSTATDVSYGPLDAHGHCLGTDG